MALVAQSGLSKANLVAIGSDHAGFELKEQIKGVLEALNLQWIDVGANSNESCDYPDYARKVAEAVAKGDCIKGIVCCGSGIGVSIVANKVRNIRAALCNDVESASLSRRHNDANVLCLGARMLSFETACEIIKVWLITEFEGGRHERRVEKIERPRKGETLKS